jgi:hypothetical protein
VAYGAAALAMLFGINWIFQVARKPTEIFAPISGSFANTPATTWRAYGALFQQHSTSIISPEFLAALAQVESGGNPIASTYWRWQWSWNPFEVYRPASSAVGMFQITDGTFAEARTYCVRARDVARAGRWYDTNSCWLNQLYTRILPGHATEMTAAYLHQSVTEILNKRRGTRPTLAQKERLAAVVDVFGKGRGVRVARRGFRTGAHERCGSHDLSRYLANIEAMKSRFARLRRSEAI